MLAAWVPELRDEARALAFDRLCGSFEAILVFGLVAGHGRGLAERRGIDRNDLSDDQSGAAFGALRQEIDPAIGDAVARAVVCRGGGQRNPIAQRAPPDPQRAEQPREIGIFAHVETSHPKTSSGLSLRQHHVGDQ